MIQSSWIRCWKFGKCGTIAQRAPAKLIALTGCLAIASSNLPAFAQVTADPSLGTQVNGSASIPCTTNCNITGGTLDTTQKNLFHSFQNFSVQGTANFNNATSIQNIFSRVTGSNQSNINGIIRANGTANVFLLNPNGILFGPNAQLNIGGSFVATTANAILFNDNQNAFIPSTSQNNVLLLVKPSALFFNQLEAKKITNQSVAENPTNSSITDGLRVREGKSLLLVGGNVNLEGGTLRASGGKVELGGVLGTGTIGLIVDGNNLSLSFPVGVQRADVSLTNGAQVNVRSGGSGSIVVNAQNLKMEQASTLQAGIASNLGSLDSKAGNIAIDATQGITLTGGSTITNAVQDQGIGKAGDVTINANTISLDGEAITSKGSTSSSGVYSQLKKGAEGEGGNINITAEKLSVTNGAVITTSTRALGNAGNVTINADTVSFDGMGNFDPQQGNRQGSGGFSAVAVGGEGQGGNVSVTARVLTLTNGGALVTSTLNKGNAGNIFIDADTVVIDGVFVPPPGQGLNSDFGFSGAYSRVDSKAVGDGGNVNIKARSLSLINGGTVTTSTSGKGNAGYVTIEQADTVFLDGKTKDNSPSSLIADTSSSSDAGGLTINTKQLIVQNGAQVSAKTFGAGRAGSLVVNATDFVIVDGKGSTLDFDSRSRSTNAGDAGDLQIFTQRLLVQNGAQVSARTVGAGDAGTLLVNATDSVTIDGKDSRLRFDTEGSGNAQGLKIETGRLVVQNGGQVTVSGTGTGNPGNLEIIANSIFLNNQGLKDQRGLIAQTQSGVGGNISLQVRDDIQMRNQSLISASASGPGNGGNIQIEISNGFILAFLPENSDIIASAKQGNGGVARATAAGVFGFRQFIDRSTRESDFTASSELGIDGTTEIITPRRRLEELPADFAEGEIAQGCEALRGQNPNRFVVTGRGGLPPSPKEALSKDAIQVDWVTSNPKQENPSSSAIPQNPQSVGAKHSGNNLSDLPKIDYPNASPFRQDNMTLQTTSKAPLVEAQGWVINSQGQVVLIANAATVTPHLPWRPPTSCPVLNLTK